MCNTGTGTGIEMGDSGEVAGWVGDGGPAFPGEVRPGMSLRDWFAGMALQGIAAGSRGKWDADEAASDAYEAADSMLRKKQAISSAIDAASPWAGLYGKKGITGHE